MKLIFLLLFIALGSSFADYKRLRCLVLTMTAADKVVETSTICKATIDEMTKQIDKVNPKKKIQVGGYRVDESGQMVQKYVPFARSGMHISELMDSICEKMQDYVRVTDKNTGKLLIMKLISDDGKMNPDLGNYDVVQDSDLNQSLNFYCEGIVEEFEDDIYNGLKEPSSDPVNEICMKATNICESTVKEEL